MAVGHNIDTKSKVLNASATEAHLVDACHSNVPCGSCCHAVLRCAVACRQLHGMSDFSALARVIPVAVAYRAAPLHVSGL